MSATETKKRDISLSWNAAARQYVNVNVISLNCKLAILVLLLILFSTKLTTRVFYICITWRTYEATNCRMTTTNWPKSTPNSSLITHASFSGAGCLSPAVTFRLRPSLSNFLLLGLLRVLIFPGCPSSFALTIFDGRRAFRRSGWRRMLH